MAAKLRVEIRAAIDQSAEEDEEVLQVVARRSAWASLIAQRAAADGRPDTPRLKGSASVGIERAGTTLAEMRYALSALRVHLEELGRGLAAGASGPAEAFFGGHGSLAALLAAAKETLRGAAEAEAEVRQQAALLASFSSVWVELPEPEAAAACLERGVLSLREAAEQACFLEPHSRAARARASAGKALSAEMLAAAMLAGSRPIDDHTVSALAALLQESEGDSTEVMHLLTSTWQASFVDYDLPRVLRALAIMRKLSDDEDHRPRLLAIPCLLEALEELANANLVAGPAAERAKSLAAEFRHHLLEAEANVRPQPCIFCVGVFHKLFGAGEVVASARSAYNETWPSTRARAKELGRKLLWYRNIPSSVGAVAVLDDLFVHLDALAGSLARLHEELLCLSDGAAAEAGEGEGDGETEVPALLLFAASMQSSALDWKSTLLNSSADRSVQGIATTAAAVTKPRHRSWETPAARLSGFLDRAVIAGDCLDARCVLLAAQRNLEVERLKMCIEASGQFALSRAAATECCA